MGPRASNPQAAPPGGRAPHRHGASDQAASRAPPWTYQPLRGQAARYCREGLAAMAITMFDQWPFSLACGHTVVLGRLDKAETWTCETCGKITDLRVEPYRKELEDDRYTADQIDKQARQRGETVVRADPTDPPRS